MSTKFLIMCSCIICKKELTTANLIKHAAIHLKSEKFCVKCSITHFKKGDYCSYKCSNSRNHSNETKQKISDTFSKKSIKPICKICSVQVSKGRTTCIPCRRDINANTLSKRPSNFHIEMSKKGGKISASKRVKRSKDEIALFKLCSNHFINVEHNKPIFNGWDADIIIHDTKTAILWNGPWHYTQMPLSNHSLLQVQNRDKIKIQEIQKLGWSVLVFEDRYFTPHTAFNALLVARPGVEPGACGYEPHEIPLLHLATKF